MGSLPGTGLTNGYSPAGFSSSGSLTLIGLRSPCACANLRISSEQILEASLRTPHTPVCLPSLPCHFAGRQRSLPRPLSPLSALATGAALIPFPFASSPFCLARSTLATYLRTATSRFGLPVGFVFGTLRSPSPSVFLMPPVPFHFLDGIRSFHLPPWLAVWYFAAFTSWPLLMLLFFVQV